MHNSKNLMKHLIAFALVWCCGMHVTAYGQAAAGKTSAAQTTICNPLNLSYRFCLDKPSRREAADPMVLVFKNEYYLFASKSGGYWHSRDLMNWDLITTNDLPLEDYAPAAVVMNDMVYFMASSDTPKIYKTTDPKSGKWQVANASFPIGMIDPCLFLDDDGRLYFYYGCSNINPLYGVELDTKTLNPIGTPKVLFNSHMDMFGWERSGDYNEQPDRPWIEGSWMTKHNGKYYLQYAAPGTQYKSYCDGAYVSDSPLGQYVAASNNPCSSKPEGFIAGAGHSGTFKDLYGNYWHISTMTISQKHMFERRLGLFPMFFDKDGEFYTWTSFGDFPFVMPKKKLRSAEELSPKGMLLSYKKPVEVSSELPAYPKKHASDEDIRTYWSAKTGQKGEWLSMDLGTACTISSVQINYAENETEIYGRTQEMYYQYLLEYSLDHKTWKTLEDKTKNTTDVPHDYIELRTPVKARYLRLTNYHVPSGTFALADLRVFGSSGGALPQEIKKAAIVRMPADKCIAMLKWDRPAGAIGVNIRYGIAKDKLYHAYQVLGTDTLTIRSLDARSKYYFAIDAISESGIRKGKTIFTVE